MGCSNPHPHGQIWASEIIPDELEMEMEQQDAYWEGQESELLSDYLALELKQRQRIACENEHFVVVVPFWAMWPFETLVLGRRSVDSLLELIPPERTALADILRQITIRYDNLFQAPFPYTMGIHQAPVNGPELLGFQFHVHFYPPLLRSATIRKFMVGYEMLAMPQRDITPEAAAEKLRSLPANYYLDK